MRLSRTSFLVETPDGEVALGLREDTGVVRVLGLNSSALRQAVTVAGPPREHAVCGRTVDGRKLTMRTEKIAPRPTVMAPSRMNSHLPDR